MSHGKHPCVIWCAKSLSNWKWLKEFTLALNEEYKYRYNKECDHKSAAICRLLKEPNMEDEGMTERPQCMPDQYKVEGDAAQGYRNYYIGEKQYFAKWTKRAVPKWYTEGCEEYNKLHPETPTTPAQKKAIDLKLKKEKEKIKKEKERAKREKGGKKATKKKKEGEEKSGKKKKEKSSKKTTKEKEVKKGAGLKKKEKSKIKLKEKIVIEVTTTTAIKMETRSSKRKSLDEVSDTAAIVPASKKLRRASAS
jgi:hypothetical protein